MFLKVILLLTMTIRRLFLYVFLIYFHSVFSQKQNNQWRFSGGGGIDFNTNPPTAVACAQMLTSEGMASVSDRTTGALLFYTNGVTVWNAQDQVMPNGTGLLGGDPILLSSTTAAVIIPKPNSTNLYYLITIDEQFGGNDVCYSVVDMSLQSGQGDIVAGQKNIPICPPRNSEKLEVVPAADGINYWLITHDPNGIFIAFKVSESGIDNTNPVLSNVGISHGNGSGHLKVNSQFNRLAMGNIFNSDIELYNFDRVTGIVSNPVTFNFNYTNPGIYGVEFSPNGRFLYITNLEKIVQYDISFPSVIDIENSGYEISLSSFGQPATLQLGPNGKIYVQNGTIHAINNPDNGGAACNFEVNAIANQIGGGGYGLPKWVYLHTPPPVPVNKILYGDTCYGSSTFFTLQDTINIEGLSWDFGDPNSGTNNTSTTFGTNHIFSDTGTYIITANISYITGSMTSTATIRILPLPNAGIINGPSTIEINNTAAYSNNIQNGVWSSSNNSVASISLNGFVSAINTGSTTISYSITDNNGCSNTTSRSISVVPVFVPKKDNVFYIPNAFIPGRGNDPEINTLKVYGPEIKSATLKIFNQWGQCIFVSDNPKQKGWDGKYKGIIQPAGLYVYGIEIIFNDGSKINKSNSVNLIR